MISKNKFKFKNKFLHLTTRIKKSVLNSKFLIQSLIFKLILSYKKKYSSFFI
jgi:hypothetical protein